MSETEPGLAGSGPDSALLKVPVALREFSKVTAELLGEDVSVWWGRQVGVPTSGGLPGEVSLKLGFSFSALVDVGSR